MPLPRTVIPTQCWLCQDSLFLTKGAKALLYCVTANTLEIEYFLLVLPRANTVIQVQKQAQLGANCKDIGPTPAFLTQANLPWKNISLHRQRGAMSFQPQLPAFYIKNKQKEKRVQRLLRESVPD